MSKQQKAEMEHGLEAAGLLDRPVEEKENLVAKQLAYLASDFPHSRLLENQALYRSVLEKNCPKQGLSLSERNFETELPYNCKKMCHNIHHTFVLE
jgi:hypothetical protein